MNSSEIFLDKSTGSLVGVTLGRTSLLQEAEWDARAVKRLAEKYPDIDFNYYGVPAWSMTNAAGKYSHTPLNQAWLGFSRDIASVVDVQTMQVRDWNSTFFRTDHHWKPAGAYQGYLDIAALLAHGNPRFGTERLRFSQQVVDGVKFQGANARRAAFDEFAEPFLRGWNASSVRRYRSVLAVRFWPLEELGVVAFQIQLGDELWVSLGNRSSRPDSNYRFALCRSHLTTSSSAHLKCQYMILIRSAPHSGLAL